MKTTAFLVCIVVAGSCGSPAPVYYQQPQAQRAPAASKKSSSNPVSINPTLLLFGGPANEEFLGTLNQSKYEADSIWNQYGTHGSPFSPNSIWNEFGTYGSSFSRFSPWNSFTTTPPVVVDSAGNFYGYFTRNKYLPNRTRIESLVALLDNYEWIAGNLDEVRAELP